MKGLLSGLGLLALLSTGLNALDTNNSNLATERSAMLEYYTSQGPMTDPGKHINLYEGLPDDVAGLVKVVQGAFLHIFWARAYGVQLTQEKASSVGMRTLEAKLAEIEKMDNRPIVEPRELENRLVANCRDYSLLLCSLLKYKGIPARARCGFGAYFMPGKYMDHWICEYWDVRRSEWVRVDAQLDSVQVKALGIEFDPLALPEGAFLAGGEAWTLCRAGKLDPDKCGFFDPPNLKGMWFIRGDMIRDFMALNKLEVLPWDSNDSGLMGIPDDKLTESDYAMLDKVAQLTTSGDSAFTELRELYESDSILRMPADWNP
ncbi:transglutaminase domain-containing protein [bacterium]|nr:transglutaminase domain-containing protein [bacterium]